MAAKIVYTGLATPYCSVYVADASAAHICRLVWREARYSLSVQKPKHFWITRMLDGGSVKFFSWYVRNELCVAARREELVYHSSVAQTVTSFIHCQQIMISSAAGEVMSGRCKVSQFFKGGWVFQHHF